MSHEVVVCGLGARIMRSWGWRAVTLFGHRYYWDDDDVPTQPDERLRRHEAVHVEQQKRLGWKFYPAYLWELARRGYRDNKFEVEARMLSQ